MSYNRAQESGCIHCTQHDRASSRTPSDPRATDLSETTRFGAPQSFQNLSLMLGSFCLWRIDAATIYDPKSNAFRSCSAAFQEGCLQRGEQVVPPEPSRATHLFQFHGGCGSLQVQTAQYQWVNCYRLPAKTCAEKARVKYAVFEGAFLQFKGCKCGSIKGVGRLKSVTIYIVAFAPCDLRP